jgi:hypothetical protein
LKSFKLAFGVLLLSVCSVSYSSSWLYEGTWDVGFFNGDVYTEVNGGLVSTVVEEIDATHRVFTMVMYPESDPDRFWEGFCGNDVPSITIVMNGVLSGGAWAFSISSETPDAPPPNYPTLGVAGDMLSVTNAAPGIMSLDSNIGGSDINAPYCTHFTATGTMTNAATAEIGDTITIDFDIDTWTPGHINLTIQDPVILEDSFEATAD